MFFVSKGITLAISGREVSARYFIYIYSFSSCKSQSTAFTKMTLILEIPLSFNKFSLLIPLPLELLVRRMYISIKKI